MNIYLVEARGPYKFDYDTYDSLVCIAKDEEDAKKVNPNDIYPRVSKEDYIPANFSSWVSDFAHLKVTYLGEADPSFTARQLICSSFNAG